MATFSRTHRFASGLGAGVFLPVGGHDLHGHKEAVIWSDDGAAYTLRITRGNGVALDAPVPATPSHYMSLDLHPDAIINIEVSSAAGSTINVEVS